MPHLRRLQPAGGIHRVELRHEGLDCIAVPNFNLKRRFRLHCCDRQPTDLLRSTVISGVEELANRVERDILAIIDDAC
jgi:hypothetical protein